MKRPTTTKKTKRNKKEIEQHILKWGREIENLVNKKEEVRRVGVRVQNEYKEDCHQYNTFVSEDVDDSHDECLWTFGAVFHQR